MTTKLTGREKKMMIREKVALELVSTEETYCNGLQSIVINFMKPAEKMLKEQYIAEIFSNVDQIFKLHFEMLYELKKCCDNWSEKSCVAEAFMKIIPYLQLYKPYCSNHCDAGVRLAECKSSSNRFASHLATTEEETQTTLSSLLILPIQRIPRYRLLFQEILKNTPEDHNDYKPIQETLESICKVAAFVNESVRQKENQEKILEIQQSLSGSKIPAIVQPGRVFLHEGVLVKMCRREPKSRYFFLFNDLLVYCTVENESDKTYAFHRAIGLQQLRVDDIPDNSGMENAFQILSNQKSFSVFAETPQEKLVWMTKINEAIQLCYQLQHKQATGKDPDPTDIAPVWIPDKLLKNCMLCDVKFTTITRRHHCRKCGKLICNACSGKKFKLENIGKVCRVCDECFDELKNGATSKTDESSVKSKRSSIMMQSLNLTQTAEAQADINRRATKIFKKDNESTRSEPKFAPSYKPAPLLTHLSSPVIENPIPPVSGGSGPEIRKKKKKKKPRSNRAQSLDLGERGLDELSDSDSEGPPFAAPPSPAPARNEEGFFDYESEEEDSLEFLPPPERPPPLAPTLK